MRETFEALVARVSAGAFIPQDAWSSIMAKPVKLAKGREFNFKSTKGGGESKYAWDEWFKGDLLLLEQSEGDKDDKGVVVNITAKKDYEVDTNNMPGKLKSAARKRYKVVQISRKDADGHKLENALIIKARDMDAAERAEEDQKRAEEKAEKAAKKAAEKAAGNGQAAATAQP